MKKLTLLSAMVLVACSTSSRQPDSIGATPLAIPQDSLTLEQALKQGQEQTLAYLKNDLKASAFQELPPDLKFEKIIVPADPDKKMRHSFIRKFHPWSLEKKAQRAEILKTQFQCGDFHEAQALGLSLEINFPDAKAVALAEELHQKVMGCDVSFKEDSVLRLTVFSIYKNDCPRALTYLENLPAASQKGNTDRITYLKNFRIKRP